MDNEPALDDPLMTDDDDAAIMFSHAAASGSRHTAAPQERLAYTSLKGGCPGTLRQELSQMSHEFKGRPGERGLQDTQFECLKRLIRTVAHRCGRCHRRSSFKHDSLFCTDSLRTSAA